ncbi:MAG: YbhB/YbcL family Raf kinase inhibitor-like protein [Pseudomonadota bacterium]
MSLTLQSTMIVDGGEIPARYTCEGEDVSPPLAWSGVPENARSLVLIVDDPDAPDPRAPRMTWVHWVLYNLPPDTTGLVENATSGDLAPGSQEGINDWKRSGYGGPCPPVGRHRYFHKLYALERVLEPMRKATKADVEAAMQGHVIAEAVLMGTYEKSR